MAAGAILLAASLSLSHLCHGVTAAPSTPPPPPPLLLPQVQRPLAAPEALPLSFGDATTQQPPPPIIPVANAQPKKLKGRFLHITDFHPDEFYKVHSSTAADHACHSGDGTAGTYGAETSDCDAPVALVNATFDWIAANVRDAVDFVIWTGDSARHDSDETIPRSPDQVIGTNRLLAAKFAETFGSDATANGDDDGDRSGVRAQRLSVPVVPTFGNNDILPHNILLPGPNKWLARYADIWDAFIPEEQRHSFEFGGWYYVEVIPNTLAVFSLNTLYFFDRNAGVDDCVKPSEPGFKHLEWLRVQLQFMRDRGMKAILMGHVPPARTDSKMLWDETCWQKYTLWLRQYRDVVVTGLFGHMNIDHFMLADTNDINIDSTAEAGPDDDNDADVDVDADEVFTRENLDDELTILSATDYLEELRQGWAKLPKVKLNGGVESEAEAGSKKNKKKKKKDKAKKKLGGEFAERYQLSLVSPSIVPNYFPTLRIFEYNITGLEDAVTWAEYNQPFPVVDPPDLYVQQQEDEEEGAGPELELRDLPDVEADKKKKKGKKGKKGKKPITDPNLVIPRPPAKTAPPGPAYSPQTLTLVGYEQYFANLTYLNNDIAAAGDEEEEGGGDGELSPARWREGKHGNKKPKSNKPKPREFAFEIEYATRDDPIYNMTDLTVREFVRLAYRMGRAAGQGKGKVVPGVADDDVAMDLGEVDHDDLDDAFDEFDESQSDDLDAEKSKDKKKGDKKKKKKKKKAKKLNKTWLHFLKHAFVSTVDDEDLREQFS